MDPPPAASSSSPSTTAPPPSSSSTSSNSSSSSSTPSSSSPAVGPFPLLSACAAGDISEIKRLLDGSGGSGGLDINGTDPRGNTPLLVACEKGIMDLVTLLIERGGDVNAATLELGTTPLMRACRKGHLAVATLLLERGAKVGTANKMGDTALTFACELDNNASLVELLVTKHGANVHAATINGQTPLILAACGGHTAILTLLCERGALLDSVEAQYGGTALFHAIDAGHRDAALLLLKRGANTHVITKNGQSMLARACAHRDDVLVAELLRLLEESPSMKATILGHVDEKKDTALHTAASRSAPRIAELLLAAGAQRDAKNAAGETPLDVANRQITELALPGRSIEKERDAAKALQAVLAGTLSTAPTVEWK